MSVISERGCVSDLQKVFTAYDIQACLYDEDRVGYFRAAIEATVKPGDVVVDAGSGSGLLGMLAAKAGARLVYCVEINQQYVNIIEEHARRNGLSDQIVAICDDATTIDLPEDVDVIISEVISAGFFDEPQLQILSNLRRFLRPTGAVIPHSMVNYVELIDAQEEIYGLKFNYDTRFKRLNDVALTSSTRYLDVDFGAENSHSISANVQVKAERAGIANALRVSYGINFTPDVYSEKPTEFLLNPQIIYLNEPVEISDRDTIEIALEYQASTSPMDCKIHCNVISEQFDRPDMGIQREPGSTDPRILASIGQGATEI